eukprot:CAMPEP_0182483950 /NCGR_PEP_ID=MMETSP1319-20130603/42488_1 /TAXON_ID=172717 /ORGANISM="Bolidomonas pacifica, Strain RCC208" /LENGTH=464 /DNA_ID=CAMNT_0024685811 /DNA_START=104 /DNA_END=1495 /DNA_ORIENTATION=+
MHARRFRRCMLLLMLLMFSTPTLPTSDFEASQATISSTSYKSLACWFGSCSPSESTTTLTAEPLPSSPYVPVPEAPTPVPATQPSYTIKMTQQEDTGSDSTVEASQLNYELQLKNVPAAVIANVPFALTVIFMETTTNTLVYTDPAGVYGAPFDVTISLHSAEVDGDSLPSWVLFDMKFGGTLTKPLHFAVAEFDDLTLNIPSTYVYLKVEAKAHGLSFVGSNIIKVTSATLAEEESLSVSLSDSEIELGSVSVYDREMNQYTVDASAKALAADAAASSMNSHTHFDGTFIVHDYYKDPTCKSQLMYYEYTKLGSCIVTSVNSSSVLSSYSSVQTFTDSYKNSLICEELSSNITADATNKETVVANRGECVPTGNDYKKIRGVKTSVMDSNVCEDPYTPVVRVSEWYGGRGGGNCHAGNGQQPTIRLYPINMCHILPSGSGSFMFTGCYHDYSGLLNEYKSNDC